jgi:preprotein translocase subunit SecE
MAMNREQKRAAQRQGLAGADGAPVATRDRSRPAQRLKEERTSPKQFMSEVMAELRKTSWPTRQETIRLAIIVFIAIIVLTAFIFGIDLLFGDLLGRLFDTTSDTTAAAALPLLAFLPRSL